MSDGWSKVGDAVSDPSKLFTGDLWGDKDKKKRSDAEQAAIDAYKGIDVPDMPTITPDAYQYQGGYDPSLMHSGGTLGYDPVTAERMNAVAMGPSAMEGVNTDPRLRDQQMASMAALKGIADNGGANLTDQANLARVQSGVGQADRGRRDAILQQSHARGLGGGGQELMAQLSSGQAATDRQAQSGIDIAAQAQQRALQAIMQGGSMAGDMRNQDFGEQSRIAQARDAVSQFNAQQATGANRTNMDAGNSMAQFNAGNKLRTGQYNIDNTNSINRYNAGATTDAAKYAASGRQDAADRTVGANNTAKQYNAALPGKTFDMKMNKAHGVASAYGGQAASNQSDLDNDRSGFRDFATFGGAGAAKVADKYGPGAAAVAGAHGGIVPGHARVSGDSYANDTVPALLSPGEIDIPRSVAGQSPEKIAAFVKLLKRQSNNKIAPASAMNDDDTKRAALAILAKKGA